MVGISPFVKIRPFRYGNCGVALTNTALLSIVKIRPFRYGNRNEGDYVDIVPTLKSDSFGMEISFFLMLSLLHSIPFVKIRPFRYGNTIV